MSIAAIGSRAWPAEAVDMLVRMARGGHSDVEIAARLRLSPSAVGRKRRELGVAAGLPGRLRIVMARRALPNGGRKSLS
jgi:hypothetical protein